MTQEDVEAIAAMPGIFERIPAVRVVKPRLRLGGGSGLRLRLGLRFSPLLLFRNIVLHQHIGGFLG